jgi:hypothetical protein
MFKFKKSFLLLFTLFYFVAFLSFSQIPIKRIESEIKNLKNPTEIEAYWKQLYNLDQDILVNIENNIQQDSLSLEIMIRTALMFKIHGVKVYDKNNIIPILNLSHCSVSEAQIVFWPIILECKKSGGVIDFFGGKYPAYELESISLKFYNYSLINKEDVYPLLLNKIRYDTINTISDKILKIFEKQKKNYELKPIISYGKWFNQAFENIKENDFFELIKMNDKSMYIKNRNRIQKLILIKSKKQTKTYRIENEPFGWFYQLDKNGNLFLKNIDGKVLIQYSKYQ